MSTIAEKLKTTYLGLAGLTTSIRQLLSVGAKEVTSQEINNKLNGVAQETTSQDILEEISGIKGDNPDATNSAIYNAINAISPDIVQGKEQLATAITSKGVETTSADSLSQMAENVSNIAQESYTIDGGEMYEKQLFGAPTDKTNPYEQPDTPKWNLYQVMANLLSDGRFVKYGGILLAEFAKDSDTQNLEGAGTGGAYLTSDGKMYTEDVIHTWDDTLDEKMNRWIAYCFASEWHGFTLGTIDPTSIHIGRKVGTITCTKSGRLSKIVVTDGNELYNFNSAGYSQHWDDHITLTLKEKTTETSSYIIYESSSTYIHLICENIAGNAIRQYNSKTVKSVKIDANSITTTIGNECVCLGYQASIVEITANSITGAYKLLNTPPKHLIIKAESLDAIISQNKAPTGDIYLRYISNDKTRSFRIIDNPFSTSCNIYLQAGWNKPLNISPVNTLDEDTIYKNILQQLKQDEELCGSGVTITLGSTNLARLTSDESIALLDSLTNTYGYTFA